MFHITNYKKMSKFYRYTLTRFLLIAIILISIFLVFQIRDRYNQTKEIVEKSVEFHALESARIIDQKLKLAINILNDAVTSEEVSVFLNQDTLNQYEMLLVQKRLSKTANLLEDIEISLAIYNSKVNRVVSNLQSFTLQNFLKSINEENPINFMNLISQIDYSLYEIGETGREQIVYAYQKPYSKDSVLLIMFEKSSLLTHIRETQPLFNFEIIVSETPPENFLIQSSVLDNLYYNEILAPGIYDTFIYENILSILSIILSLIPLCIFLVFFLTNKTYKPIKELILDHDNTTNHSSQSVLFDEIEYIKNLIKTTTSNLSSEEIILKEILYGIYKEDLDDIILKNNINLSINDIYFIYLTNKTHTPQDILSAQYIKFMFSEIIDCRNIVKISGHGYVVFIQGIHREDLMKKLSNLPDIFDEFYIILSKVSNIYNINLSFYHINELVKTRSIANKESILNEEDILITKDDTIGFTRNDEKILIYHIGKKNKSEYINIVNKVLNISLELYDNTKKDDILMSIAETLRRLNPTLDIKQAVFDAISSINDIVELKSIIIGLFLDYYDLINAENITNDIKYEFINFIKNNYSQDISLVDLADNFNLSMNYVGVLFKEKTGENFKTYLNTYRINVAKQIMLENPNIKIKDLSLAVGFANINTFIRVFKEQEGISPGKYQKLNLHI